MGSAAFTLSSDIRFSNFSQAPQMKIAPLSIFYFKAEIRTFTGKGSLPPFCNGASIQRFVTFRDSK